MRGNTATLLLYFIGGYSRIYLNCGASHCGRVTFRTFRRQCSKCEDCGPHELITNRGDGPNTDDHLTIIYHYLVILDRITNHAALIRHLQRLKNS